MAVRNRVVGVTHPRQGPARWPDDRVEERAMERRAAVVAGQLDAIALDRGAVVGERDHLHPGDRPGLGQIDLRRAERGGQQEHETDTAEPDHTFGSHPLAYSRLQWDMASGS